MAFVTRDELRRWKFDLVEMTKAASSERKTAGKAWVFLSHSHKDAEEVEKLRLILANQGVELYIDWKDHTMPAVTNPETATVLKRKIQECKKLVLLATNNALASKWVPWEIGIADSANGMNSVAVMPIEDTGTPWTGNEYIGIYPRLVKADNGALAVFAAGKDQGWWLADWLKM